MKLSQNKPLSIASRSRKVFLNPIVVATSLYMASFLPAQAADWSSTNVQLLHGNGFELGEDSRTIFTLENATGWKYGDTFFFIDVTEPTGDGTELYAEFSPRFSFSKIFGSDLSFGFVKDIMLATNFEMGEDINTTLIGVGLPLDIPGFAYADINLYVRDSHRDFAEEQTDTGGQVTLTWNRPFSIGASKWNFEGFFDYAFGEDSGSDPKEDNIITAPRIMLNLGENIQVGVEYQIWENKFGVDGVDEDVAQAMVKWVF
jgi:nucleoside-specific outer membrane channel protein Tsx